MWINRIAMWQTPQFDYGCCCLVCCQYLFASGPKCDRFLPFCCHHWYRHESYFPPTIITHHKFYTWSNVYSVLDLPSVLMLRHQIMRPLTILIVKLCTRLITTIHKLAMIIQRTARLPVNISGAFSTRLNSIKMTASEWKSTWNMWRRKNTSEISWKTMNLERLKCQNVSVSIRF